MRTAKPENVARIERIREYRARLRAAGICILSGFGTHKKRGTVIHGKPVSKGGKCQRCIDVHAKSAGTSADRESARDTGLYDQLPRRAPPRAYVVTY